MESTDRAPSAKKEYSPFVNGLGSNLARGLLGVVPLAATIWILWWVFVLLDELIPTERWFGRYVPGLGIALFVAFVMLVGLLAMSAEVRQVSIRIEAGVLRVPIVKHIYSTIRDFVDAIFGRKRFDKPVLVKLAGGFDAEVLGFITRENLSALGIADKVAVYFPQSFNWGGNVLILPPERLTPIPVDSAVVMSFLLTGGVAKVGPDPALWRLRRLVRRPRLRRTLEDG